MTSGLAIYSATMGAAPHSWLFGTGGAIGGGTPVAIGAAVAAPDAKVICIAGDGAAMYTNQSFWTMAREKLDVLTIICANRSYRILNIEFERTGAGAPGPIGQQMLSLDNPAIDWVKLAEAQGVPATRATTSEEFESQLQRFFCSKRPDADRGGDLTLSRMRAGDMRALTSASAPRPRRFSQSACHSMACASIRRRACRFRRWCRWARPSCFHAGGRHMISAL
ncbi:MAG: thiamine pyrophosphate-dependent enzyme [Alphaproteobacteria bacterium]